MADKKYDLLLKHFHGDFLFLSTG